MPSGCASPRAQRPASADRPAWLPHPPTLTIQQRSPRSGGPTAEEYGGHAPCGSGLVVPACSVGWSEPGNQAKGGDAWWAGGRCAGPGRSACSPARGSTRAAGAAAVPRPDDPRPCTPQTCDWRCRADRVHGPAVLQPRRPAVPGARHRPLAAELNRLWRVRVTGKRRTARKEGGHGVDGWQALPQGAAGLAPRCPPHGDGSTARASRTHVGGDRWSRPAPVGDLGPARLRPAAQRARPVSPCTSRRGAAAPPSTRPGRRVRSASPPAAAQAFDPHIQRCGGEPLLSFLSQGDTASAP
jgi:hypothetical protein